MGDKSNVYAPTCYLNPNGLARNQSADLLFHQLENGSNWFVEPVNDCWVECRECCWD